jgi:ribonuclease E
MKKEMLINVLQPEECRIAILEDGILEELYVERTSHESYVGNIYKGRIVNIEPSIQAAFVDFGVGRNGFLHVSDVEPTYYRHLEQRGERHGGGRGRGRDRGRFEDEEAIYTAPEMEPASAEPEPLPAGDEGGADFFEATELLEEPGAPETAAPSGEPAAPAMERESQAPTVEPAEPPTGFEPLMALPETRIEEEPGPRGRRRSRGTPRRRRGAAPEQPAESDQPIEPPAEVPSPHPLSPEGRGAEAPPEGDEPPKADRPRFMDSAERRTSEKDHGSGATPEINPPHDPGPSGADDDLLFFPSAPPAARPVREPVEAPPTPPRPEPVAREERREPEEPSRPAESEPRRDRGDRGPRGERGGRGGRPGRGGRGEREGRGRPRSIEEELAADLAAADIAEVPSEEFAGETGTIEGEPPEFGEPGAPAEDAFDETAVEEAPEFVAEAPPRPREGGRREEGRERDRGRGRDRERETRGGGSRGRRNGRRMGGRPGSGRPKPLIQDIFRRGQEVIVQVIKEGIGTKGPTLSTYISIAGRYLVLMPGLNRVGVSRKIADDDQRRRLREIFNELKPPRGLGFIIRTAGVDRNAKELQRDLAYLSRLWQVVVRRIRKSKTPAVIYEESDMITRTIRDTFTNDIDTIWVDERRAFEDAQEFMQVVMPRFADRIKLYDATEPLFHKYGIEDEIARIQLRKVPLPNGGSIVIEQTEALVAIDVNSGNFRADNNAEETAYQMNLHAAKEIARQLRLRDLGGVIVNDFIDMREEKHRRSVEKAMRDAVKRDRARTKILKISPFGLIEMTRQRIRPSLKRSVYQDCPYCHGMAQVKTVESMSIEVMRLLQLAAHRDYIARVEVHVTQDVANYLLNKKRKEIAALEASGTFGVQITGATGLPPETLEFVCLDNNGNEVKLFHEPVPAGRSRR